MSRRTLLIAVAVLAFGGLLLWSTLSSQKSECFVVVAYGGGTDSATASAADEALAEEQARTTACGTLARGMNESIACANTPPVTRRCRTL